MNSSSSKVAAYRCSPSSPRRTVMSRSPPAAIAYRACNAVHKLRDERPANSARWDESHGTSSAARESKRPTRVSFSGDTEPVHTLLVSGTRSLQVACEQGSPTLLTSSRFIYNSRSKELKAYALQISSKCEWCWRRDGED